MEWHFQYEVLFANFIRGEYLNIFSESPIALGFQKISMLTISLFVSVCILRHFYLVFRVFSYEVQEFSLLASLLTNPANSEISCILNF